MVRFRGVLVAAWALGIVVLFSSTGGCGSNKNNPLGDDGSGDDSGFGSSGGSGGSSNGGGSSSSGGQVFDNPSDGAAAAACSGGGLGCYVRTDCTTSISGTVYDPAGANPLYNVVVFVPNDPAGTLTPIKQGTNSCNSCDVSIGDYVTATTSKADGTFTLTGVPATTHVPLVVQIGKWRREVFLSQVKACTNNVLSGSSLTRLPAKRSEGDIPQMALVTGGADNLGCFLKGVGLDPSEYSKPGGGGRLDIYQGLPAATSILGLVSVGGSPGLTGGGAGDCTTDNPNCVWNSRTNFEKYDIVLLSCEGNAFDPDDSDGEGGRGGGFGGGASNKTRTAKQALHDWLDEGGKVFATHYHYTWFRNSPQPDFQNVANWLGSSGAQGGNAAYDVDTSFTKGMVLDQWLGTVKALNGTQITLNNVAKSVSTVNPTAQRWIYDPSNSYVKYLSFVTPIGGISLPPSDAGSEMAPQYCGKAVFSDLHAGGSPSGDIPGSCSGPPLTPQLKALEFLFFDLSACVANDSLPPPPLPQPAK
ncbi:MAG TPA: carboxypeptidase-like regulatory domain-containing protein [Polyangiaceae bacterium]|jgi:hypothetical protein|nr:carboxypeptidase-like regulatory domain-containing protein [Polyangiaceae bacterium]